MGLIALIGASGSGKTTIAQAVEVEHSPKVEVFYFDRIGVPSSEEMIAAYGSGEEWQRAKTLEWMQKLSALGSSRSLLFEGQTRLEFLDEGAELMHLAYVPILIDCDDETRATRLTVARGQPELANDDMMEWAAYLRREAQLRGCEVLDTSQLTLKDCVARILTRLNNL